MSLLRSPVLLLALGLSLASASGYLASEALSITSAQQQATRTVTINVGTGEQGPAGPAGPIGPTGEPGPQGPPGPPGTGTGTITNVSEISCPSGYEWGDLVINHPGGQVTIFTCLKD